jgi:DNA replication and repair protein RecF
MLQRLVLRNFRNYVEAEVEFCDRINLFIGDNAQGKTSLLEAIHFLMLGRSFRSPHTKDLIHRNADGFFLEAHFRKNGVNQSLRFSLFGNDRKIFLNNTECSSASALFGILVGTLVAPDDDLIKGPPQVRRLFMDLQLAQADPLYLHHITRYNRAMKQRNHLLRNKTVHTIETWEQEMAQAAAYVTNKRKQLIESLTPLAQKLYFLWSDGKNQLSVNYQTKIFDSQLEKSKVEYIKQFHLHRKKEMLLGSSLIGPHRDEITIKLDGMEARTFASEGQKRLCVTALRLASWELLRKTAEMTPLMLIDDLTVSLDPHFQAKVMDHLEQLGQVFISSTIDLSCKAERRHFMVRNGTITANAL